MTYKVKSNPPGEDPLEDPDVWRNASFRLISATLNVKEDKVGSDGNHLEGLLKQPLSDSLQNEGPFQF